jgi:hypothetical protein
VARDFTHINFGWIGYWPPGPKTIGTQPDMLEYVTGRAAGWDCPIALFADLKALEAHPRTADNLEVLRRWEDARTEGWLTEDQKAGLRNLQQEHTLLINEQGKFELAPYEQIECVGGKEQGARAFLFERHGEVYVVYWHTSGEGILELPLEARQLVIMKELGKPQRVEGRANTVKLPLGERRYLACKSLARHQVIAAFRTARLLSS